MNKAPALALVVLAKSVSEMKDFDRQFSSRSECDELIQIVNPEMRFGGLGSIGNRFLQSVQSDVFGIVHADTTFQPGSLSIFRDVAYFGNLLTGIVGRCLDVSRGVHGGYAWCYDVGDHLSDGVEDTSQTIFQTVSTLDGCSVFLRRDLPVRFDDKEFDNFHCCVEDLCLSAQSQGIRSVVPKTEASHAGSINRPSNWMSEYWQYRHKLNLKWIGRFPEFLTP